MTTTFIEKEDSIDKGHDIKISGLKDTEGTVPVQLLSNIEVLVYIPCTLIVCVWQTRMDPLCHFKTLDRNGETSSRERADHLYKRNILCN